MKIIKRYKNRRLYDSEDKKHITHEELAEIVRLREPFKIIDNTSGKDITLPVLGRLYVEELKKNKDIRKTKEILIEAINLGGKKSMSILRNTFLAGIGIFNVTKKKAEEIVDSLIKAGEISKSERKQAVMELLDKAEDSTKKMKDKIVKESSGIQKEFNKIAEKVKKATDKLPSQKIMAELERINKRIDALSKKINEKG